MVLSFLLLIIGTIVTFIMSVVGVVLSAIVSSGWVIPTILLIIAFIVLAILLVCAIHKKLTDPAKKERFLSESSDDKYADFESEYIHDEVKENVFEEEADDAFELVQVNSKIFDKKFDTKAVGYWTDAVKRFCRNKASLVCFILLAILILLSVIGEPISPYKADTPVNERFRYLAPKWPGLSKLGILDGSSKVSDVNLNVIVYANEDAKKSFKFKNLLESVDQTWYKQQDYDIKKISESTQYDSRFIVSMEDPVLVEKWEQVRDEKGNVVRDPDTGEVQLYKAFYYTVTFKYDRYAYLMQKYSRANNSLVQTAEYLNTALKANGKEGKITEAILTSIASRVKTVTVPDLTTGTPFIDPVTNLPVLDVNGNPVIDPSTCDLIQIKPKTGTYYPEFADELNKELLNYFGVSTVEELPVAASTGQKTNKSYQYSLIIDPTQVGEINENTCFVFGTDGVGRDMWCRIWSGLGLSMLIGLAVGIFSIVFGICWGAVSGYYGGLIDILMERFTDILVNVPSMIILTLLNLYLGNAGKGSVLVFILALIMTSWVGIASRTRIQFYRYKNREYVLASRTMGAKDRRLIFKHILPNGIGPLVNSAVSIIPASMRFETSMSYLGIASMSENSIGQIISSASDFVTSPQAYLLVIPSIIFSIIMVSFSVMGLGLRDALNPSLRGS